MAVRHFVLILLIALLPAAGVGAKEPLPHRYAEVDINSGPVRNAGAARTTTFSETVAVDGVSWIRLFFSDIELGQLENRSDATVLRITSLEDGAVQLHTAQSLQHWRNSSAFFNGDAVRVELIADPDAPPSRLRITEVMVSTPSVAVADKSICGPDDDRTLLNDARVARIVPVGCTAWLINDAEGCFLSAGHCTGANFDVVEFNVPLSDANGAVNHPGPQDQYPIDLSSLQTENTVIGNDWAYFGAFPNGQTLLTPSEVQGAAYTLGMPAAPNGETIRITGHGTTSGTQGVPLSWSQVGTTHSGPYVSLTGTALRYATDTTGGNSGSAVLNENTNEAIGIHTNAGCGAGGGSNSGTGLNNAGVQNALANPAGICANGPPLLRVTLNGSIADPLPLAGDTFQVDIVDRSGAAATINSATLVYDAGAGDQTAALTAVGGATWEATLPAMACGTDVTFRVDVEATNGSTVLHPYGAFSALDRRYRRLVAAGRDATFHDDFESDMGWTVVDDAGLTAGAWERGIPAGYGTRSDPPWDGDSSGSLYATALPGGNTDVDGGATRLVSPTLDASVGNDPHISYWRWWDDTGASDDTFVVEVSDDDGGSWTTLETVGPNVTGSWVYSTFRIADFVTPNNQFRIRFVASDVGAGSIVEAAIDGVTLSNTASVAVCGTPIFSDGFESGNTSAWSATVP